MPIDHRFIARLCREAYGSPPDIADTDLVACATVTPSLDGHIYVAFRGTDPDNVHDDLADLEFIPRMVHGFGRVHRGFWDAGRGITSQVAARVTGQTYHLTGHSLGGAIALVVAAKLVEAGMPPATLTTFGAPRVGMVEAAGAMKRLLARQTVTTMYRHANAPVPHLPPQVAMVEDWQHPVPLTQLGDADEAIDWLDIRKTLADRLGDHAIAAYETAVTLATLG